MAAKNEVSILIRAKDAAAGVFRRVQRNLRAVGTVAKDVTKFVGGTALAVGGAILGLEKLAERGDRVINVQRAFARVTGDAEGALRKLRTASQGTITDFDLMVGFNKAIALGSARNADEFSEMIRVSRALSKTLGIDMNYALESLNTGIARQSKQWLDNLGIQVSIEKANEDYARSIGKTVDQLTDAQKAEAFRTAAMSAAREATAKLGTGTDTAGAAGERFVTTFKNVRDRVAEFVAESPNVATFFETLSQGLETLSQKLPGIINKLADFGRTVVGMFDPIGSRVSQEIDAFQKQSAAKTVEGSRARLRLSDRDAIRQITELAGLERDMTRQGIIDEAGKITEAVAGPGPTPEQAALIERRETLKEEIEVQRRFREWLVDWVRSLETAGASGATGGRTNVEGTVATGPGLGSLTGPFASARVPLVASARFTTPADLFGGIGLAAGRGEGPALANPFLDPNADLGIFDGAAGQLRLFGGKADKIKKGGKEMEGAADAVVGSMASMAEAAITGSGQMETAVVGALQNIVSALPIPGGALIGAGLGIVGALLGRGKDDPMPVRVTDFDRAAERKLQDRRTGPDTVVVQLVDPRSGRTIDEIEYDLRRRTRTDAVERLPGGR